MARPTTDLLYWPIFESPQKEANENRYGLVSESCVCCGKHTTEKFFIHATTDWVATSLLDTEIDNSQGCFPIGPECAKKFPVQFIFE